MDTDAGALSLQELGGILITNRAAMDAAEAKWLCMLAEFDRRCGWVIDGRHDGIATMELRVPNEDEQRILRILDLAVDTMTKHPDQTSPVETPSSQSPVETPGNQCPVETPQRTWTQRRVQALLDLLEAGL